MNCRAKDIPPLAGGKWFLRIIAAQKNNKKKNFLSWTIPCNLVSLVMCWLNFPFFWFCGKCKTKCKMQNAKHRNPVFNLQRVTHTPHAQPVLFKGGITYLAANWTWISICSPSPFRGGGGHWRLTKPNVFHLVPQKKIFPPILRIFFSIFFPLFSQKFLIKNFKVRCTL